MNKAVVDGDFADALSELAECSEDAARSGDHVVAIHQHMVRRAAPNLFLSPVLHFWGVCPSKRCLRMDFARRSTVLLLPIKLALSATAP